MLKTSTSGNKSSTDDHKAARASPRRLRGALPAPARAERGPTAGSGAAAGAGRLPCARRCRRRPPDSLRARPPPRRQPIGAGRRGSGARPAAPFALPPSLPLRPPGPAPARGLPEGEVRACLPRHIGGPGAESSPGSAGSLAPSRRRAGVSAAALRRLSARSPRPPPGRAPVMPMCHRAAPPKSRTGLRPRTAPARGGRAARPPPAPSPSRPGPAPRLAPSLPPARPGPARPGRRWPPPARPAGGAGAPRGPARTEGQRCDGREGCGPALRGSRLGVEPPAHVEPRVVSRRLEECGERMLEEISVWGVISKNVQRTGTCEALQYLANHPQGPKLSKIFELAFKISYRKVKISHLLSQRKAKQHTHTMNTQSCLWGTSILTNNNPGKQENTCAKKTPVQIILTNKKIAMPRYSAVTPPVHPDHMHCPSAIIFH